MNAFLDNGLEDVYSKIGDVMGSSIFSMMPEGENKETIKQHINETLNIIKSIHLTYLYINEYKILILVILFIVLILMLIVWLANILNPILIYISMNRNNRPNRSRRVNRSNRYHRVRLNESI